VADRNERFNLRGPEKVSFQKRNAGELNATKRAKMGRESGFGYRQAGPMRQPSEQLPRPH